MTILRRLFAAREGATDLLDHPDIRRMSLRELADLPLPSLAAANDPGDSDADAADLGKGPSGRVE